jgi:hypothetical protein
MEGKDKLLGVLAAALCGAALALMGAPSVASQAGSEPPAIGAAAPEPTPPRAPILPASAPPAAAATAARISARDPALPPEVRLCWTPSARAAVGGAVRAHLEAGAARVRTFLESERGARGRLLRGDDDLALVAGEPAAEEAAHGLVSRVLGYHVVVAVVHPDNPLRGLPRHLLRAAMVGEATDWQHVGSPVSARIGVVGAGEDAFTDQASPRVLLGDRLARGAGRLRTDAEVCAAVAADPHALGLCALAAARAAAPAVRVLEVDGVVPCAAAAAAGRYPFAAPVRIVARARAALAWLHGCRAADSLP